MRFIYSDLGQRYRGDVVTFRLSGSQANIGLIDSATFPAFRSGRDFRGVVRLAEASPLQLVVPNAGRWDAVIYLPVGSRGPRSRLD